MLLEYSYDNANKILNMFNEGKIATLEIAPVAGSDKFAMEYTLITEYPSAQIAKIRLAMSNPNSFSVRTKVTHLLNEFIEHQTTNTVVKFRLSFSAINSMVCSSSSVCQYGNTHVSTLSKEISDCVDNLERLVTKLGISYNSVPDMYCKKGKKKNMPVTVKDLVTVLKNILEE